MKTAPAIRGLYKWSPASGSFIQVIKNLSGIPELLDGIDPSFALAQAYFMNVDSDTTMNYDNNAIMIGSGQPPVSTLPAVTGVNFVSAEARVKWDPVTVNGAAADFLVTVDNLYPTQVIGTSYPVNTLAAGQHTIKVSVIVNNDVYKPGPATELTFTIGGSTDAPPAVTGLAYDSTGKSVKWNPAVTTHTFTYGYSLVCDKGTTATQATDTNTLTQLPSVSVDAWITNGYVNFKFEVWVNYTDVTPSVKGPSANLTFTAQNTPAGPFAITSTSFQNNAVIPLKYLDKAIAGAGNVSPALSWVQPTPGTKSFAILCEDLTVPTVHWALYNIPGNVTSIPEGLAKGANVTVNGVSYSQAENYLSNYGYDGPNPPQGDPVHQYRFRIYFLTQTTLPNNLTAAQLNAEIQKDINFGNVSITGTYQAGGTTPPVTSVPAVGALSFDSNSHIVIWAPLVNTENVPYKYLVFVDNATTPLLAETACFGVNANIADGSHTIKVQAFIPNSTPVQTGAMSQPLTINVSGTRAYTTFPTISNFRLDTASQSFKWDPSAAGSKYRMYASYSSTSGGYYSNNEIFFSNPILTNTVTLADVRAELQKAGNVGTNCLIEVVATAGGLASGIKSAALLVPPATAAPLYFTVNGFAVPSVPAAPGLSGVMRAATAYDPAKHTIKVYDQISGTVYPSAGDSTNPANYMSQIPIDGTPKTIIAEIRDKAGNVLSRNIVGKCPIASEVPAAVKKLELKNVPIDEKSTALAALAFEKVNAMPNIPAFNYAAMTADANGLISKALAANELTPYAQTLQKNVGGESVVTAVKMAREAVPQITDGISQLETGIATIKSMSAPLANLPGAGPYIAMNEALVLSLETFKTELAGVKTLIVNALNAVPTASVPNPKAASDLITAYIKAVKAQDKFSADITKYNTDNNQFTSLIPVGMPQPPDMTMPPAGAPSSLTLGTSVITKDTDPASIPNIISQLQQGQ